jgi:hypothetical protein
VLFERAASALLHASGPSEKAATAFGKKERKRFEDVDAGHGQKSTVDNTESRESRRL